MAERKSSLRSFLKNDFNPYIEDEELHRIQDSILQDLPRDRELKTPEDLWMHLENIGKLPIDENPAEAMAYLEKLFKNEQPLLNKLLGYQSKPQHQNSLKEDASTKDQSMSSRAEETPVPKIVNKKMLNLTEQFDYLKDRLGYNWKPVLRKLNVEDHHIPNIVCNSKGDGIQETIYAALSWWHSLYPYGTQQDLINALKECELCRLSEELEQQKFRKIIAR